MKSEHSIKFRTTNSQKRDLNHSVQYSMKSDDLKSTNATIVNKNNIFTSPESEGSPVNFNNINAPKKRKVLESFNLVTVNKKGGRKPGNRSINPSYRETSRYTNYSTIDQTNVFGILPVSTKNNKPNTDFLFTKSNRFRKTSNFKNFRKFKVNQRRTATNSPNYHDSCKFG